MSKLFAKVASFFRSGTQVGVDKTGNRYFTRLEDIDGIMKEKRWVIFKGEEDPTSIPVEWICWLNGQRKKAPSPQELMELEARREHVKLNIAIMKKEEEEKKLKFNHLQQCKATSKVAGPDLKSFIQQFPSASSSEKKGTLPEDLRVKSDENTEEVRSSEPTGSGSTFKPGTWQPPT